MKNDLIIDFTPYFEKQRKSAPLEIRKAFLDILTLYREEPHHPILRNHPLKGKLAGYRSIDATQDWRAIFKEAHRGNQKVVIFHMVGTHRTLYG